MQANGSRILIVDDDKIILSILAKFLQRAGYQTDVAETSREALEKVKNQYYDVALMDIKLPDMEGTDLLLIMNRTSPRMTKIMMTGFASKENRERSLNRGADAYLVKPIAPQQLLKTIKEKLSAK
ncbi:MAG: response regulator [Thaumarchaeota archaeon]|nr:response regulator [Nitrososphaerota archaeon]MCL5317805.1 response regulator [Nitrososphaerota archaeon]